MPPPLPIFRSVVQAELLGLLFLNAQREWTRKELADRLGAAPLTVHRELQRALQAGLVTRQALGRTHLYRAATDSPLFEPLRLLLERTVGVEAELRRALEEMPGVEAAFIHGSVASGAAVRPASDVDVLVLGDVDYRALRRRFREIERRSGRRIDLLAYDRDEFRLMAERGNSLAHAIVEGPVVPLVGSRDALPSIG